MADEPIFPARVPFTAPQISPTYDPQQMRTTMNGIKRAIPPMVTRTVFSDTKIAATDDTVLVDTTRGDINVTLLPANQVQFLRVQIQNIGTGSVLVLGTIDGIEDLMLVPLATIILQSDGSSWRRLKRPDNYLFNLLDFGGRSNSLTYDNTEAAYRVAEAIQSNGYGALYMPYGMWRFVEGRIPFSFLSNHIRGDGKRATDIFHDPLDTDTDARLFDFRTTDNTVLYQGSVRHLTIRSSITNRAIKTAILATDTSGLDISDISLFRYSTYGSIDGSLHTDTPSRAIDWRGRELGKIIDCDLYADQNIYVGRNPQWVSSGPGDLACLSMDSYNIRNLYALTDTDEYHITVDPNAGLTSNFTMDGQNTFIKGKGVFKWDASTAIAADTNDVTSMYFGHFRHESGVGGSGAYGIYIDHPLHSIYNVTCDGNNYSSTGGGHYFRGVRYAIARDCNYEGTNPLLHAFDIDASVKGYTLDNYWIAPNAGYSAVDCDLADASGKLYYVEDAHPPFGHYQPRGQTIVGGPYDNPAACFFIGPYLKFLTATHKTLLPSTVWQFLDSTGNTLRGQIFNSGSISWTNAIAATAFNTSGSVTATLDIIGRKHYSQRVNTAFAGGPIPPATPTTVMALPGTGPSNYDVQAVFISAASAHQACARIAQGDTGAAVIFDQVTAGVTTLVISLSGTNIQITHNEATSYNCIVTLLGKV